MPSYVEGDNIEVVVSGTKTMLKPILFTTYESETKYNLHITYEDSTTKDVELVQNCKDRPYKFVYKKEGKLLQSIGIPKIYEINEGNKYVDFPNKVMDSSDLLFVVDCSNKYECIKTKFYLKDIRDIVDIAIEGEDPNDPMDIFPITTYPIYLNGYSCQNIIKLKVDDTMITTLTPEITKMGEPLTSEDYSDFSVIAISDQDIIYEVGEDNVITVYMTEATLDKEIKITVRCFIKEINHPIFDEFVFTVSKKSDDDTEEDTGYSLRRAVSTQDMQYLGDGLETGLGNDLTPGFKPYRYRKSSK